MFASQHSTSTDQGPIARVYGCKWAWCRSTFRDHAELNHHVVHEHARRAIPVRRRDIPMIRRAEEGVGESLKISDLMTGSYSSRTAEGYQKSAVKDVTMASATEPSSSLPSPPASSPASLSPSHEEHLPEHGQYSDPPLENGFNDNPLASSAQPSQEQQGTVPTFASLSSPAGSQTSLAIPDSPSFSSLVERPNKRKIAFEALEKASRVKANSSRYHPLSQSSASYSSTDSQLSVEQQLTQSPDSGNAEDIEDVVDEEEKNSDLDTSGEDDVPEQSPDRNAVPGPSSTPSASLASHQDRDIYKAQLRWNSSQLEASQNTFDTESESHPQESAIADLESMSQPPSQFQHSSFPFHHHGPKASSSKLRAIETEPDSSAPLHLSSPAPLSSPTFAVSTPQRQNWYQPSPRHKNNSKGAGQSAFTEDIPNPSPPKRDLAASQRTSHRSRTPKSKNVFRSGTLQITPAPLPPEPFAEESEGHAQNEALLRDILAVQDNSYDPWAGSQSQPYLDSTQPSQDLSYPPLQTQAPYQSQSMTQF